MSVTSLLFAGALLAAPPNAEPASSTPTAFLEMFVAGVVPTPDGHTLVLVNADERVLLPVGIGLPEALSIHGRLEHRVTTRPLTHDLLDDVLKQLGGQVVRVQIDDLREDIFVARVFVRRDGKVMAFDARPSDAVALALGSRAPILVARPVVDRAAIHPGDMPSPEPDAPAAARPGERVLSL